MHPNRKMISEIISTSVGSHPMSYRLVSDMKRERRHLAIDCYSRYQGTFYADLLEHDIASMCVKVSQGDWVRDDREIILDPASRYREEHKGSFYLGTYVYYDTDYTWNDHLNPFIVGSQDWDPDFYAVDMEMYGNLWMIEDIRGVVRLTKKLASLKPTLLYLNQSMIRDVFYKHRDVLEKEINWLENHANIWLAWYPEWHDDPDRHMDPVDPSVEPGYYPNTEWLKKRIHKWQYTAFGEPGEWGFRSRTDLNVWSEDINLRTFMGWGEDPDPEPDDIPTFSYVWRTEVRIRKAPDIMRETDTGKLTIPHVEYPVLETRVSDGYLWCRHPEGWSAMYKLSEEHASHPWGELKERHEHL